MSITLDSSSMVNGSIRATITVEDGSSVTFSCNPLNYTVSSSARWKPSAKTDNQTSQYVGTTLRTLHASFIIDAFTVPITMPTDVMAILEKGLKPDQAGVPPPQVHFTWGTADPFTGVITSLSTNHKLFQMGNPVRSEITLSIEETPDTPQGTNPTSGGIATRRVHTVAGGDNLASVAQAVYGQPRLWRALARYNGIDDPMRIRPGTELLIPERGEAEALEP